MRESVEQSRVQRLSAFGTSLEEVMVPRPIARGTEVVLEVQAAGVCHSDVHICDGWYDLGAGRRLPLAARGVELPRVLGHEIVGVVDSAGTDVDDLVLGRSYLVYPWIGCGTCTACTSDREYLCDQPSVLGVQRDGGYASHVVVPHPRYLVEIGTIPPAQAAALACSGLTAHSALRKLPKIAGGVLMIIGAGGVGLAALDQARADSVDVLVVDIDPGALEMATEHGARWTVDGRSPDAAGRVVALVGQRLPAVLDVVGSAQSAALAFACLAKAGTLVVVGLQGGLSEWPLPLLALSSTTVRGSFVGGLEELRHLVAMTRDGTVPPPDVTRLPSRSAQRALDRLRSGGVRGRQVLDASIRDDHANQTGDQQRRLGA